jgi:hypothetical protein
MIFGYAQPFSFKVTPPAQLTIAGVRQGVTEITLSDGRVIRATLQVKSVNASAKKPGTFDVSYNVVAEVAKPSEAMVLGAHETLQ